MTDKNPTFSFIILFRLLRLFVILRFAKEHEECKYFLQPFRCESYEDAGVQEPYRTYLHDTHSIAKKCWPSYNTPYFPKIFGWSESGRMVKKYGDWFNYEKTPRALIFRRDHDDVTDMNSMIRLMSNNFIEDPLSRSRATDMKVTNSHLIESLSFTATAGPTHGPTLVFDWNRAPFKDIVPHNGQPTQWTFKLINHQWESSLYTNNQQFGPNFAQP
ncbi:hypothetical protein RB195_008278 [Necator americanus]|uniref:Phospholipase B-like n=1 Tax=Necator americanus TaxID=51031 RepID=A0ABR1CP55_NECAM